VGLDDLIHVRGSYIPVPNVVGVNHQIGAVFALVEAAGLVGAYPAFQATCQQFLFEKLLQGALCGGIATTPRVSSRALVGANENVAFKRGHVPNLQDFRQSGDNPPACAA
jgi:hypothetical protein